MTKHTGQGGKVIRDGLAIAQVIEYSWQESPGNVADETESAVSMTVAHDSELIRVGDVCDLELKLHGVDTKILSIGSVEVESVSVAVANDSLLTQSVDMKGYIRAVYAMANT